jgi:hypothetical protein
MRIAPQLGGQGNGTGAGSAGGLSGAKADDLLAFGYSGALKRSGADA